MRSANAGGQLLGSVGRCRIQEFQFVNCTPFYIIMVLAIAMVHIIYTAYDSCFTNHGLNLTM